MGSFFVLSQIRTLLGHQGHHCLLPLAAGWLPNTPEFQAEVFRITYDFLKSGDAKYWAWDSFMYSRSSTTEQRTCPAEGSSLLHHSAKGRGSLQSKDTLSGGRATEWTTLNDLLYALHSTVHAGVFLHVHRWKKLISALGLLSSHCLQPSETWDPLLILEAEGPSPQWQTHWH